MIKAASRGFMSTFTGAGLGAVAGLVVVLVLLAYVGWTPEKIAANLKNRA